MGSLFPDPYFFLLPSNPGSEYSVKQSNDKKHHKHQDILGFFNVKRELGWDEKIIPDKAHWVAASKMGPVP